MRAVMRRIRDGVAVLLIASGLGAAGAGAGAGAAQAATLTVDHPCYYSFGGAHETIVVTAAGFKPRVQVNLTFLGWTFHTNRFTDSSGRVKARFQAPRHSGPRGRVSLTASDGTNTATTNFYLTDVNADFSPSDGAPTRNVRFKVTGLGAVLAYLGRDPHSSVFAHYIRPNGKVKGTRKFGHLRGPCGDLTTTRTRLLPYATELGSWSVYFEATPRYRKSERAQASVSFSVR